MGIWRIQAMSAGDGGGRVCCLLAFFCCCCCAPPPPPPELFVPLLPLPRLPPPAPPPWTRGGLCCFLCFGLRLWGLPLRAAEVRLVFFFVPSPAGPSTPSSPLVGGAKRSASDPPPSDEPPSLPEEPLPEEPLPLLLAVSPLLELSPLDDPVVDPPDEEEREDSESEPKRSLSSSAAAVLVAALALAAAPDPAPDPPAPGLRRLPPDPTDAAGPVPAPDPVPFLGRLAGALAWALSAADAAFPPPPAEGEEEEAGGLPPSALDKEDARPA